MPNEQPSMLVQLPTTRIELKRLIKILKDANVATPGNYEDSDPYDLGAYIYQIELENAEFSALFDRNLLSPIIKLGKGEPIYGSKESQKLARLAAACMCFCSMAGILIEPNMALYEFAASAGNQAANFEISHFRIADNAGASAYLDIALGRSNQIPKEIVNQLKSSPDLQSQPPEEVNFEKSLRIWSPNYLIVLKTIALRRSGLSPLETAMEIIRWQAEEALFNPVGTMYCLSAIGHQPPKGNMLKSLLSVDPKKTKNGAKNATWDLCLIQQFGKVSQKQDNRRWSLWTADFALREVIQSTFLRDGETSEVKLTEFFRNYWGEKDGKKLYKNYAEHAAKALHDPNSRQEHARIVYATLKEEILRLENELQLSQTN